MNTIIKLQNVIQQSGLWEEGRTRTHSFLLSPDAYSITPQEAKDLELFALALHDCLSGLGRIAAIASSPELINSKTWNMIGRVLRTGIPDMYHDLQVIKPSRTPSVCKIDFMRTEAGAMKIAEIDGHNKHGQGYATLASRLRGVVAAGKETFPGIAPMLAKEILRLSEGSNEMAFLYSQQEKFYLPEFKILQQELLLNGIEMEIVSENEIKVVSQEIIIKGQKRCPKLWMDLPFMFHNPELNQKLAELYRNKAIDFLIPPKPFLGSKAILALLGNFQGDKELEAILASQIPTESLEILRKYLPETYLVAKLRKNEQLPIKKNRRYVLKECISSGMKGTVFSDDEKYVKAMLSAQGSWYRFVLQEEVINQGNSFKYFTPSGEEMLRARWYMRLTVHVINRQVAEMTITARQDKKVHGALDCLQLGTVIEEPQIIYPGDPMGYGF